MSPRVTLRGSVRKTLVAVCLVTGAACANAPPPASEAATPPPATAETSAASSAVTEAPVAGPAVDAGSTAAPAADAGPVYQPPPPVVIRRSHVYATMEARDRKKLRIVSLLTTS